MTQVFLSYAHEDRSRLERSLVHLAPIFEEMDLKLWWDKSLKGGQQWHPEIAKALHDSDIFVCYVTPQYRVSGYIKDHELPAIREKYLLRDALVVPLFIEDCAWQSLFRIFRKPEDVADTPLGALPKDGKGKLKATVDWSPHRKGWNAIRIQLGDAMATWLESKPALPQLPAEMVPTENGYRLVGGAGEPPQSVSQQQEALAKGIDETLGRLKPLLPGLHNASPRLAEEIAAYDQTFHVDVRDITWLWMKGFDLLGMIDVTTRAQLCECLSDETAVGVLHDLQSLANRHAALIMSTPEGASLTSKVLAAQATSKADIDRARLLLEALIGRRALYEEETRAIGDRLLQVLKAGAVNAPQLAETMVFLITSIAGFGKTLAPLAIEAAEAKKPVDDANLDGLVAETRQTLRDERKPIAAFSQKREELRRFVPWLENALQGKPPQRRVRPEGVDNNVPPPGLDENKAAEMILAGKSPPASWTPFIEELDFGNSTLRDLAPLNALTNLRELYLDNTQVGDLTPLHALKDLTILSLEGLLIINVPTEWPSQLKDVNLYRCRWPKDIPLPASAALITPDGELIGEAPEYSWLRHVYNRIQREKASADTARDT